jgi:sodium-dependent phosphate cotransporter
VTGSFPLPPAESTGRRIGRVLLLLTLLYLFLVGIGLLGSSFKMLGAGFSRALLETTGNPVIGLMTGLLATALIQSSSTTTSIVVGLVSSGSLTVTAAVPVIMGANMGTTVTNTIVAMAAIRRREEFRRSFAAATVHDIFNMLTVLVLFPLEMATGILQRTAERLSGLVVGSGGVEFANPLKAITKPASRALMDALAGTGLPDPVVGTLAVCLALGIIFLVLSRLPKLLRTMFLGRAESAFSQTMQRGGVRGLLLGIFLTVLVQSSSITTSLLVPLVGAGILTLEAAFPITLGANVGTTVTALLAATAGTQYGVTIALVHLLFNLGGIALIWPIPAVRRVPIRISRWLASRAVESRWVPVLYLVVLFFAIPGVLLFLHRAAGG